MEQTDLSFYIDSAYGVAAVLVLVLGLTSILRARRAKRQLAALESDHEA